VVNLNSMFHSVHELAVAFQFGFHCNKPCEMCPFFFFKAVLFTLLLVHAVLF